MLGDIKSMLKIHALGPPLTLTGRQIGTGNGSVVGCRPGPQGNLGNDQQQTAIQPGSESCQGRRHRRPRRLTFPRPPPEPQGQQQQQAQGGKSAQQMQGYHLRPELEGNRPHAERGLQHDKAGNEQRQFDRKPRSAIAHRGNGQPEYQ